MYNSGRYNLTRYNIPSTDGDIYYLPPVISTSVIGGYATRGENLYFAGISSSNFNNRSGGSAGIRITATNSFAFSNRAVAAVSYYARVNSLSTVEGGLRATLNIYLSPLCDSTFYSLTAICLNMLNPALSASAFGGAALAGLDFRQDAVNGYGIFNSEVSATGFETIQILLDPKIPPGGTLILDSANYTVLLDGENVIDKHSGGWLSLTRKTHDVRIDTNSGSNAAFEATILYTELYL